MDPFTKASEALLVYDMGIFYRVNKLALEHKRTVEGTGQILVSTSLTLRFVPLRVKGVI